MSRLSEFARTVLTVSLLLLSATSFAQKVAPAQNEWAGFQMAGFNLMWGKTRDIIALEWAFIIQISNSDISSIKIYDVTENSEILLVEDNAVKLKQGRWVGRSAEEQIKKGSDHWVYNGADVKKRFKAVFTTPNGETKELIQSTFHPASERRMMLLTLG